MNADKTKSFFSSLIISGYTIEDIDNHTDLGLTLPSNMSRREHILNIHQKESKRVDMLKGLRYFNQSL
jgi:hypothetical protein